ncbi:MAG: hypothetical protein COA74_13950 [Gammaproteobacteria bacterium]|nr:MAG: hypothetical protein COA74_13950 [Gammaproteobacteria bacterium]
MNTVSHEKITDKEFIKRTKGVTESEHLVISSSKSNPIPFVYLYKNKRSKKPLIKVNLVGFVEIVRAYIEALDSKIKGN